MELRRMMSFSDARIVQIAAYPSDKGVKCVLILAASLMPDNAETLGCSYIYRDGVPVPDLDGANIGGELRDVELHLPTCHDRAQYDCYYPELIYKIKVSRVADAKFEVTFRIHEASRRADLDALLQAVNKDAFACAIRSRQGELFESGTRVDLSAEKAEKQDPLFACPHCDSDMPLTEDGTRHVNEDGEVIPCVHPSATAVAAMKASREPALASAGKMKRL